MSSVARVNELMRDVHRVRALTVDIKAELTDVQGTEHRFRLSYNNVSGLNISLIHCSVFTWDRKR